MTNEPDPKAWIRARWKHEWWGLMDCDRCPRRGENAPGDGPCDTCALWPHIIREHYRPRRRKP